jgi:hypothetical protein
VSGKPDVHDALTKEHCDNSPTVNTGDITEGTTLFGDNKVVAVFEVVALVDTVVEVVPNAVDIIATRPTHTLSPTLNNDLPDARFNRYNSSSPNPNRTANRDHESFANAT